MPLNISVPLQKRGVCLKTHPRQSPSVNSRVLHMLKNVGSKGFSSRKVNGL